MMYRQILVKPEQRPLQRILWRNNSSIPVYTYQLNTVTYGLTSSSFLAIRCLFELAQQIHETDPEAANIIRNNMYVDDLLVGFDNEEQALKTCQRLESILRAAGFPLRKWISNNNSITSFMERESSNTNMSLSFDTGESAKILGLYWMPTNDTLNYKCASSLHKSENITKRQVLSAITRIFDPLGLLSPCVVKAKILMQSIWSNKIDWDDRLPEPMLVEWNSFLTDLPNIGRIQIRRQARASGSSINMELHGFADASELAYGACIFIRSHDHDGHICILSFTLL